MLCDAFSRGAVEAGHDVKKIILQQKDINFCLGCYACQRNGGNCIQKDDMTEVLDQMIGADVWVLATPVYFYSMNAKLKVLIDRVFAKYSQIKEKKTYLIATCKDIAVNAMEGTVAGYHWFLYCLNKVEDAGHILAYGVRRQGRGEREAYTKRGL